MNGNFFEFKTDVFSKGIESLADIQRNSEEVMTKKSDKKPPKAEKYVVKPYIRREISFLEENEKIEKLSKRVSSISEKTLGRYLMSMYERVISDKMFADSVQDKFKPSGIYGGAGKAVFKEQSQNPLVYCCKLGDDLLVFPTESVMKKNFRAVYDLVFSVETNTNEAKTFRLVMPAKVCNYDENSQDNQIIKGTVMLY